jgi:Concanavalin A-like lectin/glucanases superfamily/Right handed beta helix region
MKNITLVLIKKSLYYLIYKTTFNQSKSIFLSSKICKIFNYPNIPMKKLLPILIFFALSYSSYTQTVTLTCPTNTTTPACQSSSAVLNAFNAWLNTASASGGCNGVLTNNSSMGAPNACGGAVTVTFTYTSTCAPFLTTCNATFTVANPPSVNLTCPINTTVSANQTQAAVNSAFSTWLAGAYATGGCNGGVLTNNNNGAPDACGGTTTVTFAYTSPCSFFTTTCQSTFTVPTPLAPTGISGTTAIIIGSSTTLSVVGGVLGGAIVEWFAGSCGSTVIGTGTSITVSPTTNTTYFVRYSGGCSTTTCASVNVSVINSVSSYNFAARNTFYGIGGYSYTQQAFPNGVQANPYLVSGPLPQNDFSYAVSAIGGITNRESAISTNTTNTSISIQLYGNNVRKFSCQPVALNTFGNPTSDDIQLTATTNLGNTATQTGGFNSGAFVGFNVIGNENEYLVSITASFPTTPSPAAFLTLAGIMVGDNTPQNVALNFDGVDDHVSLPNTVGNFATNQDFTVSCWIKPADTQSGSNTDENDIISEWNGSAGAGNGYPFVIRYINTTNTIRVGQYDGSAVTYVNSSTALNDGKWHHVAFVREGGTGNDVFKLYIDGGSPITSQDNISGETTNSLPLKIGSRGNNANFFKGEIDEVRIWGIAKTATEIANERFCKTPNGLGLFNSYNFSNGVPHDINPFITQIQDAVSTNHGTLNNFAKTANVSNFVTGQVKYVKRGEYILQLGNGSSWANAFDYLQNALSANSCNDLFEVYVAKGSYNPSLNFDSHASFNIPSGMSIYGGFAGTEKSINQRNRALIQTTNETTLSGDLAANDTPFNFATNRAENSKNVVQLNGNNAVFDGFTVRGANSVSGGGIEVNSSNLIIKNCRFIDNLYSGINIRNGNTNLSNCTMAGNGETGISTYDANMLNVTNCLIVNNVNSGIIMVFNIPKLFKIVNCTISANKKGVLIYNYSGNLNIPFTNTIIHGNTNAGITSNGSGTITKTITHSLVQGETSTANGNLNGNTVNPQFASPLPNTVISDAGNYRLKDSSPCINTGTDVGVSPLDLDRNPKPRGGKTDMGAYESNVNMNEIISIATGNWEAPGTWNLERVPLATDKVILNNHTVTVTTPNAKAKNVEQKPSSNLRFNAGGSLMLHQ